MAINFPTSLDSLSNPTSTDGLDSPDHATQHADANDIVEALEAKVGVDSSAVTTSHDYKISSLEDGTQLHALTAKTTPVDSDEIGVTDSAASYVLKKLSFLNLKLAITNWNNPVGTIREFNVSTNPATLLGFGTWTAHGTGRVTVAIDSGTAGYDTVDETGGANTITLTNAHMQHSHVFSAQSTSSTSHIHGGAGNSAARAVNSSTDALGAMEANTATAHSNVQPYIVVYRWVRTV